VLRSRPPAPSWPPARDRGARPGAAAPQISCCRMKGEISASPKPRCADVIATMGHELRRPLASIRGLTKMLLGHWADFSEKDSVQMAPGLPKVPVGPLKREQVLANLSENACKHGSPGAVQVTGALKPAPGGEVVEVSVSDKGKGIATDDLARITEKFYSGAGGDERGLGLGLWVSKGIVEAHGGQLVASSVPGDRTTLGFTIPLHDGATAGKLAGQ
jgi:signal transduction histidine kinase